MRVVLDLTVAEGDHIEGTARLADTEEALSFSGWLALMRVLEELHDTGDDRPDTQSGIE